MADSSGDDAIKAVFAQFGRTRILRPGQALFFEGDPPTSVYLVLSGLIRIETTTSDGRVVLLDLASAGDLIGELGVVRSADRSAAAWGVQESTLLEISAQRFMELLATQAMVGLGVLSRTAERLGEITFQLVEASAYSAMTRVAARLVRLVEMLEGTPDQSGHIELKMPISQQELAEWAGLAREGVVGGLARLRTLHVISTGRMKVTILDMVTLRRLADGSDE